MEHLQKEIDAGHQAGTRPREVTIRVHGVNPALSNRGHVVPSVRKRCVPILSDRFLESVTTGHDNDDIGPHLENVVPLHTERRFFSLSKNIDTARELYHFWNPMTAHHRRVDPLQTEDARSRCDTVNVLGDGRHAIPQSSDKSARFAQTFSRFAHGEDVVKHIFDAMRVERQHFGLFGHFRLHRELAQSRAQIPRRRGTNVAELLSDDQVGLALSENIAFDPIKTLATGEKLPNVLVYLRGVFGRGQTRVDDDGLVPDAPWKVALVADAYQRVHEAQCADDLGRRRKQGANTHG